MVTENYIVASCKSWHKSGFEVLVKESKGTWVWVDTPEALLEAISSSRPRYIFFLHWNWRVPREVWETYECVCFHMTDVPYGRGGSPLQNLILAGHSETKLTALRMVEEMDAGPVYTKYPLFLDGAAEEIYIRAGKISYEIIRWILKEGPQPVPQVGEPVFFKRRRPDQSCLPDNIGPSETYDYIRMLDADGYPQAFIEYGDLKIYLSEAKIKGDKVLASAKITFKGQD